MRRAAGLLVVALVTACGTDDPDRTGEVEIADAVVGETPAGADAAVYFDIRSDSADAIVGASAEAAGDASLHTMEPVEGGGVMYPTDRIELPADRTIRLAPLGTHVMLESLHDDLTEGMDITLTLDFATRPDLEVDVAVVSLLDLAELLAEATE